MQFSQRLDRFGAEVFSSLNAKRLKLEAEGRTIYNLSVGTPDFAPYDHVVQALRDAAADPAQWKYSLGDLPELKQAVCDYYERRFGVEGITPDMVASCNGTQEGVGHLGLALLDPGDTVLVPDPCYPVFEAGVKIADGELAYYPLNAEHDFLPYVAGIDPEVADRAKYMIVSLPANPVGSVGTPELYEEIIAFAREHDLIIVHDNAYSDIVFDGPRGGSFLSYPGALERWAWSSSRSPSRSTSRALASAFSWVARMWWRRSRSSAAKSTSACSFPSRKPRSPRLPVLSMRLRTSASCTRSAATRSATGSRLSVGSAPMRMVRCSCG